MRKIQQFLNRLFLRFWPGRKSDGGEWKKVSDARNAALTKILGKDAGSVYTAAPPFYLGGFADVVPFPSYISGMTYGTADLTGPATAQVPNCFGQYELVMCMKQEDARAASLISMLGRYTCDVNLEPFHTMDLPRHFEDDTLRALLFVPLSDPPHSFEVLGQRCGLLLCMGITREEMQFTRTASSKRLVVLLKEQGVFPYTIPDRPPVTLPR